MEKNQSFSVRARIRSFGYAFEGIGIFFKNEHNAWIHLLSTIVVITLAFIKGVTRTEAIVLAMVIGFVWTAELFNTAIERMIDHVSPQRHPAIKFIKDVSAAAVLVAAFTALITGLFIFIPKFL